MFSLATGFQVDYTQTEKKSFFIISLFRKKNVSVQEKTVYPLICRVIIFQKVIDPSHLRFEFPQVHLVNHLDSESLNDSVCNY